MEFIEIDFLWVFIAALSQIVLGSIWYSPLLFGKKWIKLVGTTEKELNEGKKHMKKAYILSFITSLLAACVMGLFIKNLGLLTATEGVKLGFWLWLGFIATSSAQGYIFSAKKKSWELFFLENGYTMVSFMLIGAILAQWG